MEIKQITEQNPWWEDDKKIDEDEKVSEAISKSCKIDYGFEEENSLMTGPRQVGKTTFLKLFIKNLIDKGVDPKRTLYFPCDMIKDFKEIADIVRFSDSLIEGKKYIFLDEITFVDEWHRGVKFILDSPVIKDKVLYVTGSSSIALKKETFPGREIKTKHFLPLSFRDFCKVFGSENLKKELKPYGNLSVNELNERAKGLIFYFNEIEKLFNRYIQCGGFPKSMYELEENKKIKDETYEIYWKWLVSDIAKIERSERITKSILLGVLKNYGTKFSLNSIAKEMEIGSHVTVREYLEILENLFVLRNIFPSKPGKEIELFRGMRKVYFIDPFLFHAFKRELTKTEVEDREIPTLIEGIVAENLIKRFGKVFYHSKNKEVDFHIANTGIEVKWQKKVDKRDFKIEFKNKILLSKTDFEFFEKENLIIVPVPVFLLM
ncbi:MAG: hypothetical protein A7316_05425 [Candidatus Altiarchaeales archaeon WOR_SM1_86-2]|nr:MAG: hypothetical protein A7316_05425 [Candidatus Altiarchaeales archaeon WOR_SM1_86-2]ODS39738.1 MAG: hypothetical protein A7315_10590 [Candidatus Altiarchaeales archaeon WOR_SM1_79]